MRARSFPGPTVRSYVAAGGGIGGVPQSCGACVPLSPGLAELEPQPGSEVGGARPVWIHQELRSSPRVRARKLSLLAISAIAPVRKIPMQQRHRPSVEKIADASMYQRSIQRCPWTSDQDRRTE